MDINAAHSIDNHIDGMSVLRSLFNAVNRKDIVRAYSYWEPGSPQLVQLSNPSIQGTPPFRPLAIRAATKSRTVRQRFPAMLRRIKAAA
jgi:hypothetical protein